MLGPIYRPSTASERQAVRQRHGIHAGDSVCVFSMGGGGVQSASASDLPNFLAVATKVGVELQRMIPTTRLLFVRGPLFPDAVSIPGLFEVVRDEPCVPALLAVARGAVIRAGFNTTWECLAGGTPFVPVEGGSFQEPQEIRLRNLRQLGYVSDDLRGTWSDADWISSKDRQAEWITNKWPGSPDPTILQQQLSNCAGAPREARRRWTDIVRGWSGKSYLLGLRPTGNKRAANPKLAIRIDDVIGLDDQRVSWLLKLLLGWKLRASLEIIPYPMPIFRSGPRCAGSVPSLHGWATRLCPYPEGFKVRLALRIRDRRRAQRRRDRTDSHGTGDSAATFPCAFPRRLLPSVRRSGGLARPGMARTGRRVCILHLCQAAIAADSNRPDRHRDVELEKECSPRAPCNPRSV